MSQRFDIAFTLNGEAMTLGVAPYDLLIDMLRGQLGLTGTKRSCDAQVCGACTVLVDGLPVSSCTTLALDADGRALETIEGVAREGELGPVQKAFADHGALQCGFCTPGFVMAVTALLRENPHPDEAAIRHHLEGNICRCTGYVKILEAVKSLA